MWSALKGTGFKCKMFSAGTDKLSITAPTRVSFSAVSPVWEHRLSEIMWHLFSGLSAQPVDWPMHESTSFIYKYIKKNNSFNAFVILICAGSGSSYCVFSLSSFLSFFSVPIQVWRGMWLDFCSCFLHMLFDSRFHAVGMRRHLCLHANHHVSWCAGRKS